MKERAALRHHRRRRTGRRRLYAALTAAPALTGAVVVTTLTVQPAGAATAAVAAWPTPNGSQPVSSTIAVPGTYDGGLKRFYGSGDLGDGGQSEDQDPLLNTNYGDTATLSSIRIHGDSSRKIKPCVRYTGNNTGDEPTETGSGADGTYCRYSASDISYD
ncbi:hypothetical protein [Streptomyces sp. 061-3]|uniref:hypothetical protein n=1 Tax=Streptomyces sp. 061-3 TaxID=2789268 RepID=UPI00397EF57C